MFIICLGILVVLVMAIVVDLSHEGTRLGHGMDYLEEQGKDKFSEYHICYKHRTHEILLNIGGTEKLYRTSTILLVGKLKETGETVIVMYPDGWEEVIVNENYLDVVKKIDG